MKLVIFRGISRLIVALIVVSAVVFGFARASGDPTNLMLPETASTETRDALRAKLGLDQPVPVQFGRYLLELSKGEFGISFVSGRPVTREIADRLPATLQLAAGALILSVGFGIPMGITSALYHNRIPDALIRLFAFLGQSLPNFWVGIMAILVFSVGFGWFPAGGRVEPASMVLPAATMAMFVTSGIVRVLRSSMLEELRANYVSTALSKGLSSGAIIVRHVTRNAMIPTVTYVGIAMVMAFLSGSIVIETVFAWPGIGRLMYDSILARNFPVVQAITLLITAMYVLINSVLDLLYTWLDPRTRVSH